MRKKFFKLDLKEKGRFILLNIDNINYIHVNREIKEFTVDISDKNITIGFDTEEELDNLLERFHTTLRQEY